MESGKCDVCGETGYLTQCVLCEKKACPKCYLPMKNICAACKEAGDTDLSCRSMNGKY